MNVPCGRIVGLMIADGSCSQVCKLEHLPPYLQAAINRFNVQLPTQEQKYTPDRISVRAEVSYICNMELDYGEVFPDCHRRLETRGE